MLRYLEIFILAEIWQWYLLDISTWMFYIVRLNHVQNCALPLNSIYATAPTKNLRVFIDSSLSLSIHTQLITKLYP